MYGINKITSSYAFICCIFFSGDSITDQTRNIQPGQCFDFVQPQVGFDGTGFAKLGIRFPSVRNIFLLQFKCMANNNI